MAEDLLSQLLECSFRGIPFPVESFETSGSHDAKSHKRVDRDGARIETTGRNPDTYTVRMPLFSGVARGKGETWDDLFPFTFLQLEDAYNDRSTGILVHPIYGERKVKILSRSYALDPGERDGVHYTATFEETREDDAEAESLLDSTPLAIGKQAALELEAQLGALDPPLPVPPIPPEDMSIGELFDKVGAAVDSVGLVAAQAMGAVDGIVAKATGVIDSCERVANLPSPLEKGAETFGHVVDTCNTIIDTANTLKEKFTLSETDIGTFIVKADTTLSSVARQLRNTVTELIGLNPLLMGSVKVPAFALVKYRRKS